MRNTLSKICLLAALALLPAGAALAAGPDFKKYASQRKALDAALTVYRSGNGRLALPAFEKLAKKNNPLAAYFRLIILEDAEAAPEKKKALAAQAAAFIPDILVLAGNGDTAAQNLMGNIFSTGAPGVEKNPEESASWFAKAAEQGYAPAQCNLGLAYDGGQGVPAKPEEAVTWFRKAAEQGNPAGQTRLGTAYATGRGVKADQVEALKWFALAAEQDNPQAQFHMGYARYNAMGTPRDFPGAFSWFRKAAEGGHPYAQFFTGLCYALGRGTEKNPQESFSWYRKAAAQGHDIAQMDLASFYADGFGTEKNFEESLQWTAKAAAQGYAPALGRLGMVYLDGMGVPRDPAEGVKWLRRGAEKGDPMAQYTLGKACQAGDGSEKDPEEALKWYQKAADQGLQKAKEALAALQKEEKSFSGTFKRWGRNAKRKIPGRGGKKDKAAGDETAGLPPPGTDMNRWKLHLLPFGRLSHVLPPEFTEHKTSVMELSPGITRQFVYKTDSGLTAVLIVTKIRADYPKDDSVLDKSKTSNEALLKDKGAALVTLREGELAGRRFVAMSALNWEYMDSFPQSINLGTAPAGDRPASAGDTVVFVRDGLFIEAALHRRADGKLPKAELLAGLQGLSRRWLESMRTQAKN